MKNKVMKKEMLVILAMAIVLAMPSLGMAVDINSCQDLTSAGTYILTANITTSDQSCIAITASNVVLDCDNHLITSTFNGANPAVIKIQASNVTVKNCRIVMQPQFNGAGIHISSASSNCVIERNEINISGQIGNNPNTDMWWDQCIWVYGDNNVIRHNKLNALSYDDRGITLQPEASGNTIFNNTINVLYPSDWSGEGVLIWGQSNTIEANNIYAKSGQGVGILLSMASARLNQIRNNNITVQDEAGIWIDGSLNNSITNNTINALHGTFENATGIRLANNARYNEIINNVINGNTAGAGIAYGLCYGYGICLQNSPNNNIASNNITTIGAASHGIYLLSSPSNMLALNSINAASGNGIHLESANLNSIQFNNATTNLNAGGKAIALYNSSNNSITNNNAANPATFVSGAAVLLDSLSNYNLIAENNLSVKGICVTTCGNASSSDSVSNRWDSCLKIGGSHNTARLNRITPLGFADQGISLTNTSAYNSIISNFVNVSYPGSPENWNASGEAIRVDGPNNSIEGNEIYTKASQGFGIYFSGSNSIYNTAKNNSINAADEAGIGLFQANHNNITGNKINGSPGNFGNAVGIYAYSADENNMEENKIITWDNPSLGYTFGIKLLGNSDNNTINGNNITSNATWTGISIAIYNSSNNNITRNNASVNSLLGGRAILLDDSSNYNLLAENNLSLKGRYDGQSAINRWDITVLIGGSHNTAIANIIRPLGFADQGITLATTASYNAIGHNDILINYGGAGGTAGEAIRVDGPSNTIEYNNATIVAGGQSYGIFLAYSGANHNIIRFNTIRGPALSASLLLYEGPSNNTIANNNITNPSYRGIWLANATNNTLENNSISTASYDVFYSAIFLEESSDSNNITNNSIHSNSDGIHIVSSSGNRFQENDANFNGRHGFYLENSSSNTFTNDTAIKNSQWDFWSDQNSHSNAASWFRISQLLPTIISFSYDNGIQLKGVETAPATDSRDIGKFVNAANITPSSWLNLTFHYNDTDLDSKAPYESLLKVWRYKTALPWTEAPGSAADAANNEVGANITSFSIFAPLIGLPDLTVINKTESWINEDDFNVTYTIKNIGISTAAASTASVLIEGAEKEADPISSLAADGTQTVTTGQFSCPCDTTQNITVCADKANAVNESDETNNCKINSLKCKSCSHPPEKHESYCCNVTYATPSLQPGNYINGWFDKPCSNLTGQSFQFINDHLIVESPYENCTATKECIVSQVYAKFSQELVVPEDENTSVNWIANYLPNTNNSVTQDTPIVTNSSDILNIAKQNAVTINGISPYRAMYPSQKHFDEYLNSTGRLVGASSTNNNKGTAKVIAKITGFVTNLLGIGNKPIFRGPYISMWNASLQKEVYSSAWGINESRNIQATIVNVTPDTVPYLENMTPYMPYFMSPDNNTNVTWVGRVPQHATVELKKAGDYSYNYIAPPLDTDMIWASQLCKLCNDGTICDDSNKWVLNQSKKIVEWDVQQQIPVDAGTGETCFRIINHAEDPEYDFELEPGKVYQIEVQKSASWPQQ